MTTHVHLDYKEMQSAKAEMLAKIQVEDDIDVDENGIPIVEDEDDDDEE